MQRSWEPTMQVLRADYLWPSLWFKMHMFIDLTDRVSKFFPSLHQLTLEHLHLNFEKRMRWEKLEYFSTKFSQTLSLSNQTLQTMENVSKSSKFRLDTCSFATRFKFSAHHQADRPRVLESRYFIECWDRKLTRSICDLNYLVWSKIKSV